MTVLYRPHAGEDWRDVEVIERRRDGKLVLREVGPFWPGVWLAAEHQVCFPANGYPLSADEWRLYGEGA